MTPIEQVVALLGEALRQPLRRRQVVAEFQALVWNALDPSIPRNVRDVLGELAHDLDYFEAVPAIRKDDSTYFGHERLEREIRSALRRLEEMGVNVDGSASCGTKP